VLAEYAKHGRIVDGGTQEQAEAAASRAWLADTLDGKESLLLVGTNAAAARVSAGLRAELVALGRVQEEGVTLGMLDWEGVTAGVGDPVQARALAWHLQQFEDNTTAPVTRKTYRVTALRVDGGLTVAPVVNRSAEMSDRPGWNEELGARRCNCPPATSASTSRSATPVTPRRAAVSIRGTRSKAPRAAPPGSTCVRLAAGTPTPAT